MKKRFIILAFCFMAALPAFAMKVIDTAFVFDKPVKVDIFDVSNALQARVKFNNNKMMYRKVLLSVYVSNLNCHEFTRTIMRKSTREQIAKKSDYNGVTYLTPSNYSVKRNSEPTKYVKQVFKEYPNSIYLVVKGYGLRNNLVGEFYVNGVSLNKHLIEKGYCSYVN